MRKVLRGKRIGVVLPIAVVGLLVLLTCMAIALDVGELAITRRSLQNACDLSAIGACDTCDSASADQVRLTGAQLYAANVARNMDAIPTPVATGSVTSPDGSKGTTYSIGKDTITVWYPYSDTVTDSLGLSPNYVVRVDASGRRELFLSQLCGVGSAPVAAAGVARKLSPSEAKDSLLFAIDDPAVVGTPVPVGVDISSSGTTVTGDAHSNGPVDITGNSFSITGRMEWRGSLTVNTANADALSGKHSMMGNFLQSPLTYQPSDFEPPYSGQTDDTGAYTGTAPYIPFYSNVVSGYPLPGKTTGGTGNFTWNPSGPIPGGVYYVDGDVDLSQATCSDPITVVATGTITCVGTNANWTAAMNDMLFYSTQCSFPQPPVSYAIKVSAQGGNWTGMMYAPYGNVSFSAASQTMGNYVGGIVAQTISLSAQNFAMSGTIPYSPFSGQAVTLIE